MIDVLIVGAGPTGLTLALDLTRRGAAVRIADRSAAHPRTSRAKGPNPRSLEILADLGVAEEVLPSRAGSGRTPGSRTPSTPRRLLPGRRHRRAHAPVRHGLRACRVYAAHEDLGAAEPGPVLAEVIDDQGHAAAAYGIGPGGSGLAVIRPDHHVGIVASAGDAGSVREYLRLPHGAPGMVDAVR